MIYFIWFVVYIVSFWIMLESAVCLSEVLSRCP